MEGRGPILNRLIRLKYVLTSDLVNGAGNLVLETEVLG